MQLSGTIRNIKYCAFDSLHLSGNLSHVGYVLDAESVPRLATFNPQPETKHWFWSSQKKQKKKQKKKHWSLNWKVLGKCFSFFLPWNSWQIPAGMTHWAEWDYTTLHRTIKGAWSVLHPAAAAAALCGCERAKTACSPTSFGMRQSASIPTMTQFSSRKSKQDAVKTTFWNFKCGNKSRVWSNECFSCCRVCL